MGKCPYCERLLNDVVIEEITARGFLQTSGWRAISYSCPHCHKIISVQIDPIALKNDLLNEIKR